MADQQAGSNPPETKSYDEQMAADVRSAFEEVSKAATEPVEKVEAKAEPEPKTEAKAEPEKTDLKADHPTDERRYADGTFKPGKSEATPKAEPAAKTKVETAAPQPGAQPVVQAGAPPGGFSVKTKAEWEKLPEYVRADILKREKEVSEGFAQYEGMRELRPYVDMARSQGQTLKQALDRYIGIENALRNPQQALNAILHVAGGAGFSPQRLAAELAPYLGSQGQGAPQNGAQTPFDTTIFQQWLNPLAQEVNQIKSLFQQQSEAQRSREMTAIGSVVDRFKADPAHRYYENVEPQMTRLLESGIVPRTGDYATDLQAAYDMACRQDPEISELLVNERIAKSEAARIKAEKEAGEKARLASRSITGSPSGSVRETDETKGSSAHEAARAAYHEVRGRV